ncbi:MAG: NUDIX hydrolase [bacterium]|nr:NUDIX hydrolase [bacterium]
MLFREKSRFADLNTLKLPTDHFNFHLKQLIGAGLIQKDKKGFYSLAIKGKEFANRLDTDKIVLERQAKVAVVVCAVRQHGETRQYLVQQRLKQPSYGFYGFVTGKIKWGETVSETAAREFLEETGLKAKLSLAGIEHKMDYSQRGEILEDKFFFIFRAENPKGPLTKNFEGGRNVWLTKKEILKLPDIFDDVLKIIGMVNQKNLAFLEAKYKVKRY